MKSFLLSIFCFVCFSISISAQSYTEGADLPGTGTGPAFMVTGTGITISGTVNTPGDGQGRFQVVVDIGCYITSVTYTVTDTANISVNGFFQFGPLNQQNFPPLTGSFANGPTGPFPVYDGTYDCMIAANVAANDSWSMTFNLSCSMGISTINFSDAIKIYPNPAADEIFIDALLETKQDGFIEIENALGQNVYANTLVGGENHLRILTADLPSGIYFCKMIVDGELLNTKKIIVGH